MKKIFIGIGAFFALIILALLIAPLFISVDQFRPQIIETANKNLKGKIDIAKISLSLFPQVKVKLDGVKATSTASFDNGLPFATLASVEIRLPLYSLLTGPQLSVAMVDPVVKLSSKDEKSSLSEFLPAPKATDKSTDVNGNVVGANAATPTAAAKPLNETVNEALKQLPPSIQKIVLAAKIAFLIEHADIEMADLDAPKGSLTHIKNFNLKLDNIGLNSPMVINVDLITDVASAGARMTGPLTVDGRVTAKVTNNATVVDFDIDQNMDGLDVQKAPVFHKPTGTPMSAGLHGQATLAQGLNININNLELRFANFKMAGTVEVKDALDAKKSLVKAAFKTPKVDIAPFGAIVPMVKDFSLGGNFALDLSVQGPPKDPAFNVRVDLENIKGSTPQLKQPLSDLDGTITVVGTAKNPIVKIDPMRMKIASSDIALKVGVEGIDQMKVNAVVSSTRLNVDELLGLKPVKIEAAATPPPPAANAKNLPPPAPLDESLAALAPVIDQALANPMLDKVSAVVKVNLKSVRAVGAEFADANLDLQYRDRKLNIAKSGIKAYGGAATFDASLDLKPGAFGYQMGFNLQGVKMQEITAIHAPQWKDEITGSVFSDLQIKGLGLTKAELDRNLSGSFKGEFRDGRTALPVVKVVGGVLNSLPSILGKKMELPANQKDKEFRGEFKTMKTSAQIRGRQINLETLDIAYNTQSVGLGELEFVANGWVNFDRQLELVGTALMSPEIVRIGELKGPSGKIEIPLKMKGSMDDPKTDYEYSLKILGPRIAQNALKGQLGQKAQEALKKESAKVEAAAQKEVQKAAPQVQKEAQKGVDALKKKFKF